MTRLATKLTLVQPSDEFEIDHGDARPLIPAGLYKAVYVRHEVVEMRRFGNTPKAFLWMRLVDPGETFGTELYRAYRVARAKGPRSFAVKRDSELLMMLARILEVRQRPDRLSLSQLKGMVLLVSVGTVNKTSSGTDRPAWMRYSVIRDILKKETETQP